MSIERTLATIQEIKSIEPHPNADKMEIATILGWRVCVKKGEFKPNDRIVYCEVDSVMPEKPEYEFLRPRHFRIKTIKLRGAVSQGICFPISILPVTPIEAASFHTGMDVTDILDIHKYEVPIPQGSTAIGAMPGFLRKTDQTRIQRVPDLINREQETRFLMSEKLDGASMTVYHNNGQVGVCGRNMELGDDPSCPYWAAEKKYDIINKLKLFKHNIAVQGEVLNRGNWYFPGQTEFRLFDVYDIDTATFCNHEELPDWCNHMRIPIVPQLGEYVFDGCTSIDYLVQIATMRSTIQPTEWAEGIVFNPRQEKRDVELGRMSFKVINPEYDLSH